jgi:hypothetical protein
MKHIKKKFLRDQKIAKETSSIFANAVNINAMPIQEINKKLKGDHIAYLITDKDHMIGTFHYKINKQKSVYIPEPDLVVCLFETARGNAISINEFRQKLLSEFGDVSIPLNNSYNFFSTAILTTTILFSTIEAFVNRIIPYEFKYEETNKKQTTVQNKAQIERHATFLIKITEIVPKATGKDFKLFDNGKYNTIKNLQLLRDDFTHIKSFDVDRQISYDKLYNESLKFDYMKALNAVKDYINFYNPNLIEPCLCGSDF